MHGDQPAAKPSPTTNDSHSDCLRGTACTRVSRASSRKRRTPIICKPSTTMTMPPKISIRRLLFVKMPPIALADSPIATKMTVKPAMNASACATTRRRTRAPGSALKSSRLVPVKKRQVRRHERQDARRHERHESGQKRRHDVELIHPRSTSTYLGVTPVPRAPASEERGLTGVGKERSRAALVHLSEHRPGCRSSRSARGPLVRPFVSWPVSSPSARGWRGPPDAGGLA